MLIGYEVGVINEVGRAEFVRITSCPKCLRDALMERSLTRNIRRGSMELQNGDSFIFEVMVFSNGQQTSYSRYVLVVDENAEMIAIKREPFGFVKGKLRIISSEGEPLIVEGLKPKPKRSLIREG